MAKRAHFEIFQKNLKYMPRIVFDEKSKTCLSLESDSESKNASIIKTSLQSLANPAVCVTCLKQFRIS